MKAFSTRCTSFDVAWDVVEKGIDDSTRQLQTDMLLDGCDADQIDVAIGFQQAMWAVRRIEIQAELRAFMMLAGFDVGSPRPQRGAVGRYSG